MTKTAIVLFNLGGPDTLDAVRPFLFNLFNDPAIIRLPGPLRWLVAKLASRRRAPFARKIYQQMGGGSPILELTQAQRDELQKRLGHNTDVKVFVAMRYWQPLVEQVAKDVLAFVPDRIILLPLYPQFSTTTTGSSVTAWEKSAAAAGLSCPTTTICCYPVQNSFIRAHARSLGQALKTLRASSDQTSSDVVVLFSAHGLPKRVIAAGDPYAWQVEQTAAAIIEQLQTDGEFGQNVDWRVCYQSKVGPLEWIGPKTEDVIIEVAKNHKRIVVVPIAFVSEHSETLVELDIEYRALAEQHGAAVYVRVPALGTHEDFITALAEMVRSAPEQGDDDDCRSATGARSCPRDHTQCPMKSGQGPTKRA